MVVFLDLNEEEAARRGGWGEERYEKGEMQRRVREGFEGLKGSQGEEGEDLKVVDGGGDMDVVEARIWEVVKKRVEEVESGLVGKEVRVVS